MRNCRGVAYGWACLLGLEVFQFSRVAADLALWKESTFILLALYFFLSLFARM